MEMSLSKKSYKDFENNFKNSLDNSSMKEITNTPLNSFFNTPSKKLSDNFPIKSNSFLQNTPSLLENKDSNGSISSMFKFNSITFIVFIILILAFLGYNIFNYLGKGTDFLTNILSPITSTIGFLLGETTKTTVSVASDGTKKVVNTTGDVINTTIDGIDTGTDSGISYLQKNLKKKSVVVANNNDELSEKVDNSNDIVDPEPIHTSNNKNGYCYIGKVNNTRYCAKVDESVRCESGDIYPTENKCINPNLKM